MKVRVVTPGHAFVTILPRGWCCCYVVVVKLADCVACYHAPYIVKDHNSARVTALNNTADCAEVVATCPVRYVLEDSLTTLCADLAYSKGARDVQCADLLHIPAQALWIEWCNAPWQNATQRYGFPLLDTGCQLAGRRGALIASSPDGRRGILRTFWNSPLERDVLASSVEAYFDFDTPEGEDPESPDRQNDDVLRVADPAPNKDDVLGRCFRFRYEKTWSEYYRRAAMSEEHSAAIWRHSLGTIAMDVPMILAFLLLLATRTGLPQRRPDLARLNLARRKRGRPPLLDHIEVRAPLLPEYDLHESSGDPNLRRAPRLHHVRGHLVRRGSQLFWRVPHLRGSARAGVVRSRTVLWTFDSGTKPQPPAVVATHA